MSNHWDGPERRRFGGLSETEIDAIADKAAYRALDKVYAEVGKSMLKKLAWIAGVAIIALFIWLSGKGIIK